MTTHRNELPQLSNDLFITDGGLETTLIFEKGFELPEFAAFNLFNQEGGYETLRGYYRPYINIARARNTGFILESPTWRASRDWGRKLGYTPGDLKAVNRKAIAMLEEIRNEQGQDQARMVISGCVGPRGDGYNVADKMTIAEARGYHLEQIRTLADTATDLVSAFTINYLEEAVGIVQAAQTADIPVAIGFTVETDGRLPSGQTLGEAIQAVDTVTGNGPEYYMINCAHPTHFNGSLIPDEPWVGRIRAIRANASAKSHAELDEAVEIDSGDPVALGADYAALKALLPQLNIIGGCCGTDHRHVDHICNAMTARAA